MNPSSRDRDFKTKKEDDDPNSNHNKFPKITSSSSRQWSNHKNPRIVRVSRAFGGKDRHSKVSTVRGLRDRRIRLSVPTAIQLYDLQDRLGLSQPSKVVDWLLDATKHEIDKLPPLPMLPSNFTQFHHQPTSHHQSTPNNNPQSSLSGHLYNYQNAKNLGLGYNPTKQGIINQLSHQEQQENNVQEGFGGFVAQLSAQNLFPLNNNQIASSFANLPFNSSYFHWDPSSLSLLPNHHHQTDHQTDQSQLYFAPSATNMPSIIPSFPSYITPSMENDWRQNNSQNVQQNPLFPTTTLHLISSPMKSSAMNVNSKSVHSQQNGDERRGKDDRS